METEVNNSEITKEIQVDVEKYLELIGLKIVSLPSVSVRHTCFFINYSLSNNKEIYIKILKYKNIDGKNIDQSIQNQKARELGGIEYQSYNWFSRNIHSKDLKIFTLPVLTYLEKWNAIISFKIEASDLYHSLRVSDSGNELYRVGKWMRRVHQTMEINWRNINSPDEFCQNICQRYEPFLRSSFVSSTVAYSKGLTDFDCRDILIDGDKLWCLDLCMTKYQEPQLLTVGKFVASLELLFWGTTDYVTKKVSRRLIDSFLEGYFELYDNDDYRNCKHIAMWFAMQSLLRHSWQVSQRKSSLYKIYNSYIARPILKRKIKKYYLNVYTGST